MKTNSTHDSKLIDQTIFDDEEESLIVIFKNGAMYKYMNFDEGDYNSFINASSQGSHFCTQIRDKHPTVKL